MLRRPAKAWPFDRLATMERLRRLGIVFAFVLLGVVLVSLLHGLNPLIAQPVALFGSIALAGLMTFIFVRVALVPERRYIGWVRTLTSVNARWLFFILLVAWTVGMFILAGMGLGPQQMGAPAFVMLFIGIFLFMGFIWAVIGE